MIFEGGLLLDMHRPTSEIATWRGLGEEFFGQVMLPDLTQLIITDRYEQVVTQWQQDTPWEFGDQASTAYVASKIDGTRAAGKTIVLAGGRAVVVASVGTLNAGVDVTRWMLRHEAQHVRLHQDESAAWGVHRRSGQEIVSVRPWVFVWSAQSAIDEYRCESAVHAQLPPLEPTYGPVDAKTVLRRFHEARAAWTVQRDLDKAHQIVVGAIDRLVVVAAYSAAAIAAGHDTEQRWAATPELRPIWTCLRRAPTLENPVTYADLWRYTLGASEAVDRLCRRLGVELTFTDDHEALYFP